VPDPSTSTPDDAALFHSARRGDTEAFTALYRRHQGAIYRFALHMTGSAPASEDVVQEVFLALLNIDGYDPARGPLRPFLLGIARNFALRSIAKVAEKSTESTWDTEPDDIPDGSNILTDLTRQETIESVRRAVLSLPPPFREAVVLCDLESSSYEEAASAIGCPVGTLRSRLSRARSMLAQKLGATPASTSVKAAMPAKMVRSSQ
jgi:RNA polymerase sigma-70 factor (ECF subfamily)